MPRLSQLLPFVLVATCAAKGGKRKPEPPPPPPPVGFSAVGSGECWFPPDWASLTAGDRRSLRSDAIAALVAQWNGQQGGNAALPQEGVEDAEYALLSYPEKIEEIAGQNLELCKAAQASGDVSAWGGWVSGLRRQLTANECEKPLDDTLFWYLDINTMWQGSTPVCAHKEVRITSSSGDLFKLTSKGAWINSAGSPTLPVAGSGAPCTTEQCQLGMLLVRFTGQSGVSLILPVGLDYTFDPPEHGRIEFMVNDAELSDNVYKVDNGMMHHTSVTFQPATARSVSP